MAGRTGSEKQQRSGAEAPARGARGASGGGSGAPRSRQSTRRRGPTPKGGRSKQAGSGRYTPPIPATTRHSPPWYPWMLLSLLFVGVLVIILNYVQALPASPTNWYTLGGIVALLAAAILATGYR